MAFWASWRDMKLMNAKPCVCVWQGGRTKMQEVFITFSYSSDLALCKQGGRFSNCSRGIVSNPGSETRLRVHRWDRAWEPWSTRRVHDEVIMGTVVQLVQTSPPKLDTLLLSLPFTLDCWVILSLARKILRICPKNPNRSLRSASWASSERLVTRTVVWSSEEERTQVLGTIQYIIYCDVF